MFEEDIFYKKFSQCLIQILLIDFDFTAKDVYILANKSIELYNTDLLDYMKKCSN